ncbi:hypothetical protein [Thermomonospora umbrina]|uniref:hypothetical protein n=1 Tax=Thermomonospora umbrina TaxID=111806 RepID=UPI001FEABBDC|nr:hypothetical protein [Thermomonospora umbrina]
MTIPDRASLSLYPDSMGGWPPCVRCFRADTALDSTTDTCGRCHTAHAAGRPVNLPAGDELIGTWKRIARDHINGWINDELVASALATLAPHLSMPSAQEAFTEYEVALMWQQRVESPDFAPDPDERHDDRPTERAGVRVAEALKVLIGASVPVVDESEYRIAGPLASWSNEPDVAPVHPASMSEDTRAPTTRPAVFLPQCPDGAPF